MAVPWLNACGLVIIRFSAYLLNAPSFGMWFCTVTAYVTYFFCFFFLLVVLCPLVILATLWIDELTSRATLSSPVAQEARPIKDPLCLTWVLQWAHFQFYRNCWTSNLCLSCTCCFITNLVRVTFALLKRLSLNRCCHILAIRFCNPVPVNENFATSYKKSRLACSIFYSYLCHWKTRCSHWNISFHVRLVSLLAGARLRCISFSQGLGHIP